MPTIVAATVTAAEMICGGENHQATRVKIIISRNDGQWTGRGSFDVKCHDAIAANARTVARFCWHARKQVWRDVDGLTPTRTFVGRTGAKPAIVWSAAQWTACGVAVHRR